MLIRLLLFVSNLTLLHSHYILIALRFTISYVFTKTTSPSHCLIFTFLWAFLLLDWRNTLIFHRQKTAFSSARCWILEQKSHYSPQKHATFTQKAYLLLPKTLFCSRKNSVCFFPRPILVFEESIFSHREECFHSPRRRFSLFVMIANSIHYNWKAFSLKTIRIVAKTIRLNFITHHPILTNAQSKANNAMWATWLLQIVFVKAFRQTKRHPERKFSLTSKTSRYTFATFHGKMLFSPLPPQQTI